jgi:hypothetical protein
LVVDARAGADVHARKNDDSLGALLVADRGTSTVGPRLRS